MTCSLAARERLLSTNHHRTACPGSGGYPKSRYHPLRSRAGELPTRPVTGAGGRRYARRRMALHSPPLPVLGHGWHARRFGVASALWPVSAANSLRCLEMDGWVGRLVWQWALVGWWWFAVVAVGRDDDGMGGHVSGRRMWWNLEGEEELEEVHEIPSRRHQSSHLFAALEPV